MNIEQRAVLDICSIEAVWIHIGGSDAGTG